MVGHIEFWIIAGVVVLLFGASAIPKLTRALGKAKGEFEKGMKESQSDEEKDEKTDDNPAPEKELE